MFTICFSIIQQGILVNGWKEWMTLKTGDAASTRENRRINAYIKDRLNAFELDVSEMPIIDKMEDEHQDSYYTTYLQPEDIEIPEDFLSIPLSVR